MKDTQKRDWINSQFTRCGLAIQTIEAAKRQSVSAYDARLRKLNAFSEVLLVKLSDSGQLELFSPETALSADVSSLLDAPLGGL